MAVIIVKFHHWWTHLWGYDRMAQVASDSPTRFAAHFKTPTLILHGEKDYRVPYAQGLNLYGVLTAQGVPARIVVFPDENHWILRAQSAKVGYGEVLNWLDRWLARAS